MVRITTQRPVSDIGSDIGKLSQFLKTTYDILPEREWTDVAVKLF